jgi:UDP-N-acetylglucosamine 2-epimerase (non-hydrolysing)
MAALDELTSELPLVFPVHPRTRSRLAAAGYAGDVRLIEPQGYLRFLALQAGARIVLTDSGGIQEETTVLGVPCLTLRDNTERPITVDQGTNRLVGRDPARIVAAARATLLDPPPRRRPELWDGHAADRIAEVIVHGGRASDRSRPTNR